MACKFDGSKCTSSCPKYAMCAYMETQKQLSEVFEQMNILFQAVNKMLLGAGYNVSRDSDPNKGEENDI